MPSAIAAAQTQLHGALQGHSWPAPDPQVVFGMPAEGTEQQQAIAVLGVREADEEDAALGGQRQEETFEIAVAVKVYDPAGDAQTVHTRGYQLYDEIRQAVAADPTLAGTVRRARVSSVGPSPGRPYAAALPAEGGGFVIFIDVSISCAARIT